MVLIVSCLGRAGACWLLAGDLRELLLYPEAFAVLVLGKTHSVSKNALVPMLVEGHERFVRANARLTVVSLGGGALGGLVGSAVVATFGAPWALRLGAAVFVVAGVHGIRLPRVRVGSTPSPVMDYETLQTPVVQLGAWAMALLRGSVGFVLFLLGFALRRSGEPAWVYGLVFAASGAGALLGSFIAPRLRRRVDEERLLVGALALPAVLALVAATWFGRLAVLVVPLGLGIAATSGRQAFDALVQQHAPTESRGRVFARFETIFQLAWVAGALLPVISDAGARTGFAVLGAVLLMGTVGQALSERSALQLDLALSALRSQFLEEPPTDRPEALSDAVLAAAERLADGGSPRWALLEAAAALELTLTELASTAAPADAVDRPEFATAADLRAQALGDDTVSRADALDAVVEVRAIQRQLRKA